MSILVVYAFSHPFVVEKRPPCPQARMFAVRAPDSIQVLDALSLVQTSPFRVFRQTVIIPGPHKILAPLRNVHPNQLLSSSHQPARCLYSIIVWNEHVRSRCIIRKPVSSLAPYKNIRRESAFLRIQCILVSKEVRVAENDILCRCLPCECLSYGYSMSYLRRPAMYRASHCGDRAGNSHGKFRWKCGLYFDFPSRPLRPAILLVILRSAAANRDPIAAIFPARLRSSGIWSHALSMSALHRARA